MPQPANDHTLHCTIQGEGVPIVLVHGIAASSHDWQRLTPLLTSFDYQTLAVDLPGHGDSRTLPTPESYHVSQFYNCLEDWLERMELPTPFLLVGHSLGGFLGLRYAHEHPTRLRGSVLIDPLYTPTQIPLLVRWLSSHPEWIAIAVHRIPRWLARLSLRLEPGLAAHTPPPILEQITTDYYRTAPEFVFLGRSFPDLRPILASIRTPSLVIWGRSDQTLMPASFPKLVAALPHAQGVPISNSGHQPHIAYPEHIADEIIRFDHRLLDLTTQQG